MSKCLSCFPPSHEIDGRNHRNNERKKLKIGFRKIERQTKIIRWTCGMYRYRDNIPEGDILVPCSNLGRLC